MLDITLIMILAALWNAPAGTSQASFKTDFSGDNHREVRCEGQVHFYNKPGQETLRLYQDCKGAGPGDQNREVILRFDKKQGYVINHVLKTYDRDPIENFTDTLKNVLDGAKPVTTSQPFLAGTKLLIQPTGHDFWLMRVQNPAQQNRFSEIHLIAPGYGGHLYLDYATTPAADTYEPPKGYTLGRDL